MTSATRVEVMFQNVGRKKLSWSEHLAQAPTLPILERLVRKKRALMSDDIECLFSEDHKSGHVYAGMHCVGSFEVRS